MWSFPKKLKVEEPVACFVWVNFVEQKKKVWHLTAADTTVALPSLIALALAICQQVLNIGTYLSQMNPEPSLNPHISRQNFLSLSPVSPLIQSDDKRDVFYFDTEA